MTLLFLALAGFAALTALGMFLSSSLEADEPFPPSVTVTAGEAFQLDDFSVAPGWRVSRDPKTGSVDITGLVVTNERDESWPRKASFYFMFVRDDRDVAQVGCDSRPLELGESAVVDCDSTDVRPQRYDELRVESFSG